MTRTHKEARSAITILRMQINYDRPNRKENGSKLINWFEILEIEQNSCFDLVSTLRVDRIAIS